MADPTDELSKLVEQGRQRLSQGAVPTEKAVEYAVVMPILRVLGWNPQNIAEMYPEYGVESKRVDWALLREGEPRVFLEEKAPDQNLSAHEEQLLDYAFKQGIRLAVLTNGREWWLYLPLEEGPWAERKFLVLDLINQKIEEVCLQLTQFLQKDFVYSGLAYEDAKQRYDEARERKRIRQKLPEAIREVLSSPSEQVIEFFQNQTQSQLGTLPPRELVGETLRRVIPAIPAGVPTSSPSVAVRGGQITTGLEVPPLYSTPISLIIQGEIIQLSKWKDLLIATGNWVVNHGHQLPLGKKPGYKKTFLSRSRSDLRAPGKLTNGLFIETSYSCRNCVKHARWLLHQLNLPEESLQVQYEAPNQ